MTRAPRTPPASQAPRPVVQRVRLRFAKRGRLRFTSHRDVQRAVERAVRRAGVPIAWSAGFSPHPRLSWAGAVPTGAASEAEYVEVGLAEAVDPEVLRAALDAALPPGLDVLAASPDVAVPLAEVLLASAWEVRLPGVTPAAAADPVAGLLAAAEATVRRVTKSGPRDVDVRGALHRLAVRPGSAPDPDGAPGEAVLDLVVATAVPVVRPSDVVSALVDRGLPAPDPPPVATRLAHGTWDGRAVTSLF